MVINPGTVGGHLRVIIALCHVCPTVDPHGMIIAHIGRGTHPDVNRAAITSRTRRDSATLASAYAGQTNYTKFLTDPN